eukprot:gene20708-biopygen19130
MGACHANTETWVPGVTGHWRGRGAGMTWTWRRLQALLAWVARAWNGHGAGMARTLSCDPSSMGKGRGVLSCFARALRRMEGGGAFRCPAARFMRVVVGQWGCGTPPQKRVRGGKTLKQRAGRQKSCGRSPPPALPQLGTIQFWKHESQTRRKLVHSSAFAYMRYWKCLPKCAAALPNKHPEKAAWRANMWFMRHFPAPRGGGSGEHQLEHQSPPAAPRPPAPHSLSFYAEMDESGTGGFVTPVAPTTSRITTGSVGSVGTVRRGAKKRNNFGPGNGEHRSHRTVWC